jgi:hypothetical protein
VATYLDVTVTHPAFSKVFRSTSCRRPDGTRRRTASQGTFAERIALLFAIPGERKRVACEALAPRSARW